VARSENEGNSSAERPLVVLSTAPDEAVAKRIALALLERRLVACVNILPGATSLYRWEGAVQETREVLLIAKTTRDRVEALEDALQELHPYDTPEFVVLEPEHVAPRYQAWLAGETR